MRFTRTNQLKMKIKINNFTSLLNKASYSQLIILSLISILFLNKDFSVFTALLITAVASFSYTQLIKLGSYSKIFAFLGFPIRLILIAPPCAILIHKLQSNLIALFVGFTLSQAIYVFLAWNYAKGKIRNQ